MTIIILANQAALDNQALLQAFAKATMPEDKVSVLLGLIAGAVQAPNFHLIKEDKLEKDGYQNPIVGLEVTDAKEGGDLVVSYQVAFGQVMVNLLGQDAKSWKTMLDDGTSGFRRALGSERWAAKASSNYYVGLFNSLVKHWDNASGDVRRKDGTRDWTATKQAGKRVETIGLEFGTGPSICMLQIDDKMTTSATKRDYYRLSAIKHFGMNVFVSGGIAEMTDIGAAMEAALGMTEGVSAMLNKPTTTNSGTTTTVTTGNISLL
jgi:hypothetical protein